MEWLTITVTAAAMIAVGVWAVVAYQRSLDKPGGRDGLGQVGDAFGGLVDVFNPGHGRALDELRHHEHRGPVTPSPEDAEDDDLTLLTHPDGSPRAVRVRRTKGR